VTSNRGVALVIVLVALAVCSALGLGLVLATLSERFANANYSESVHAANAAAAAVHLAARELSLVSDWDPVLTGTQQSRFMEGAVPADLAAVTNELTCGRSSSCSDLDRRASTTARPWGANNPVWRVFLRAPLATFLTIPAASADMYVVVWVGDDARETDADPLHDGGGGDGRDAVRVHAEAFGRTGTRRGVEADVIRQTAGIRVQSWRVRTPPIP
jgi:hypothetical protein